MDKKESAAKLFRTGDYSAAVKLYLGVIEMLKDIIEDFPLYKSEIKREEASIFNNIAFAYGKDNLDTKQIEYCSKVVERAPYIKDISVLIKAHLRRGLAYESNEKFKKAADDLMYVRNFEPMNKQA